MKFIYSVIGDNTQENREWLEMIGYKFRFGSTSTRNDYRFIKTKVLCTNIGNTYAIADLKYTINDVEEEKLLRNCVDPLIGKAILDKVLEIEEYNSIKQGSLF